MRLVLSGEGPTDLGKLESTPEGDVFKPGPMAWLVDQLLESKLGYSLIESYQPQSQNNCIHLITETELAKRPRSRTLLPGRRFNSGGAYFTRNAENLGQLAQQLSVTENVPVIAILFRDSDGTRSSSRTEWQEKWDSIQRGFQLAGLTTGVPMLPRPKSEAWLLCSLKNNYQNCAVLEEASGNDNSPNALKRQLETWIGHVPSAEEQAEWVKTGRVDANRIDMPSFQAFKAALAQAYNQS